MDQFFCSGLNPDHSIPNPSFFLVKTNLLGTSLNGQCFRSESGLDLDSMGSLFPDSDPGGQK
jgi:hypothetical protein